MRVRFRSPSSLPSTPPAAPDASRVRVVRGESSDLSSLPEACFDKACAIDVVYFWSSPVRDLKQIRRVLRPGGRLLLGYVAPAPGAAVRAHDIVCARGDVEGWLALAGFVDVTSLTAHDGDGGGLTWTQGVRPAADGIAEAAT